jgi:hypothetical protein
MGNAPVTALFVTSCAKSERLQAHAIVINNIFFIRKPSNFNIMEALMKNVLTKTFFIKMNFNI